MHLSIRPLRMKNLMEIISSGPPAPLCQEIFPELEKTRPLFCYIGGPGQHFGSPGTNCQRTGLAYKVGSAMPKKQITIATINVEEQRARHVYVIMETFGQSFASECWISKFCM